MMAWKWRYKMKVTFIGTSTCVPDIGSETASFIINNKVLVDTGWCNVLEMRKYGFNPLDMEYLILTHLHQDHYIGLPQLLFYLGIKQLEYSPQRPFTIIGPSKYLKKVVDKAIEFLQIFRFPELSIKLNLIPLSPGEAYKNDDFRLATFPAKHLSSKNISEEALVCKFTEIKTKKSFAFTGDTSFHPPIADFVRDVPLLIHDACHSLPKEAATIAKMANVEKLYLVHYPSEKREEILVEAKEVFPNSFLTKEGEKIFW